MASKLAWIFGIIMLVVGVLGFVPSLTTGGMLLGIFEVDTLHNVIHLLTGLLAVGAAWGAAQYVRTYFQVFGVVYALVAVVGFVQGTTVLGIIGVNMADNVLHLVLALVFLWAGFMLKEGMSAPSMSAGAAM